MSMQENFLNPNLADPFTLLRKQTARIFNDLVLTKMIFYVVHAWSAVWEKEKGVGSLKLLFYEPLTQAPIKEVTKRTKGPPFKYQ